jgi:hypothetical protein
MFLAGTEACPGLDPGTEKKRVIPKPEERRRLWRCHPEELSWLPTFCSAMSLNQRRTRELGRLHRPIKWFHKNLVMIPATDCGANRGLDAICLGPSSSAGSPSFHYPIRVAGGFRQDDSFTRDDNRGGGRNLRPPPSYRITAVFVNKVRFAASVIFPLLESLRGSTAVSIV